MGAFIAKQPNGLYCRFSSVVDCPTDWNMTEEDYIELCKQQAAEEARRVLQKYVRPFEMVKENFRPMNMTDEEFENFLKDTSKPITTSIEQQAVIEEAPIRYKVIDKRTGDDITNDHYWVIKPNGEILYWEYDLIGHMYAHPILIQEETENVH